MPELRGKTTPRIYTPPLVKGPPGPCGCGCALTDATTLGFDVIDFSENALHQPLFPWQKWLLIHMLELVNDKLRFRKVIVLVSRQNGKSLLAEILALYFMFALRAKLVLGTAQDIATAEDVWEDALDIAQNSDVLSPLLTKPKFGKGSKEFGIIDRGSYKVKAANRRGGRGARQVKLVLLDELREHQTWEAWGAITKTTNAVPEAMILALSNAGDVSSVVLRFLRLKAHKRLGDPDGAVADNDLSGLVDRSMMTEEDSKDLEDEDDSLAIFEWSAKPGTPLRDRGGWCQSNPSLGYGTITEAVLCSDVSSDPEPIFRTECMCQWIAGAINGHFPAGKWEAGKVNEAGAMAMPMIEDQPTACFEVSWDRSKAAIVYAGSRADGLPLAEVPFYRYDPDQALEWLTDEERTAKPRIIVVRKNSPAATFTDRLTKLGFVVVEWPGTEVSGACGDLYDLVNGGKDDACGDLRHGAHTALDIAAATAVIRPYGDGWSWDMSKSPTDISPLYALTGAVWGLSQEIEEQQESAYETRGVMTV